jgi:hypothetical protein
VPILLGDPATAISFAAHHLTKDAGERTATVLRADGDAKPTAAGRPIIISPACRR